MILINEYKNKFTDLYFIQSLQTQYFYLSIFLHDNTKFTLKVILHTLCIQKYNLQGK